MARAQRMVPLFLHALCVRLIRSRSSFFLSLLVYIMGPTKAKKAKTLFQTSEGETVKAKGRWLAKLASRRIAG